MVPSRVVSTSARSTEPDAGAVGDQGGVDGPPWLLGPGGAPGPRGVLRLAGEFDFDAMGHTGGQATAVGGRHGHEGSG